MAEFRTTPGQERVLRLLAGGRRTLPIKDEVATQELIGLGMVAGSDPYELTAKGEDVLLGIDGPLSDEEKAEWLAFPKTRLGRGDTPQKLLQHGWKVFSVPRARALMARWRKHGVR